MQDMGAAGIICSTAEMSAAGGCGMKINLDLVPRRQDQMEPWELLLSESQERMLVVIEQGREEEVKAIFDKWDLNCAHIGEVTEGNDLEFYWHGEMIATAPAKSLVLGGGAPIYYREYRKAAYYDVLQQFDIDNVPEPKDLKEVAKFMVGLPNLASRKFICEQYDSMVGTINMSTNNPTDAAIVNIKDTNRALAMTVDCNSRYVFADPEVGTMIAVSEAARNIVCSGGIPSAVTNCLNFGNPYNKEVYWQFVSSIKGMTAACETFKTPVTGGNVSFYNQTVLKDKTEPVFPTPTIGMIGIIEDKKFITTIPFKDKGDLIFLLGQSREDINSSQYLVHYHKIEKSPVPSFSLESEYALQEQLKMTIRAGLIKSSDDVSEGGLFQCLIEKSMPNGMGFDITTPAEIRRDAYLFGEGQSRVVVTVTQENEADFIDNMMLNGVAFDLLGHVTKGSIRIDDEDWENVDTYKNIYDNALTNIIDK
jgi:phosphoribosylformylglycinamidine synthase subunit PurL